MIEDKPDFLPDAEQREIEAIYRKGRDADQCQLRHVVAPWRCRHGWHKWSKWWVITQGHIMGEKLPVGYYIREKRFCIGCFTVQIRDVTTT